MRVALRRVGRHPNVTEVGRPAVAIVAGSQSGGRGRAMRLAPLEEPPIARPRCEDRRIGRNTAGFRHDFGKIS